MKPWDVFRTQHFTQRIKGRFFFKPTKKTAKKTAFYYLYWGIWIIWFKNCLLLQISNKLFWQFLFPIKLVWKAIFWQNWCFRKISDYKILLKILIEIVGKTCNLRINVLRTLWIGCKKGKKKRDNVGNLGPGTYK